MQISPILLAVLSFSATVLCSSYYYTYKDSTVYVNGKVYPHVSGRVAQGTQPYTKGIIKGLIRDSDGKVHSFVLTSMVEQGTFVMKCRSLDWDGAESSQVEGSITVSGESWDAMNFNGYCHSYNPDINVSVSIAGVKSLCDHNSPSEGGRAAQELTGSAGLRAANVLNYAVFGAFDNKLTVARLGQDQDYASFLEVQLDRVAAACETAQRQARRVDVVSDQLTGLDAKIADLTKLVKLMQKCTENQEQEGGKLREQMDCLALRVGSKDSDSGDLLALRQRVVSHSFDVAVVCPGGPS